ncbi:MAG: flavin reductase family protein [Clostridia bacterium]|nr:flavin reductase family protein [Clostridia bacterium]
MRVNLGEKPYIFPMPVLIIGTYDENGVPNAMNAAWGMACDMNKVAITLSADHKTVKNILKTGDFTVAMADIDNVVACDYVGIVSGNSTRDKMEKTGFTITKSEFVNAPIINELPLTLECELESYDTESEILIGVIKNVSADERILTDGKIDLTKFRPITYDGANHNYIALGEIVGHAFSDGKKLK